MIQEDYVSYETAKLLKEKGFDGECDYLYVNGNIVRAQGCRCNWNKGETIFTDYKNECSAPTTQIAMKWLREVHHIGVFPSQYCITFANQVTYPYGTCIINLDTHEIMLDDCMARTTYEQACEEAIKYCLENLI